MQCVVPENHLLLQKLQKRFEEHYDTIYITLVKSNTLQVTVSFTKEIILLKALIGKTQCINGMNIKKISQNLVPMKIRKNQK